MTNLILPGNNVVHRPRLCRSDHQPNLLEYIDTTLNESLSLNLNLTRTASSGHDQFGNTILDQYLVYLLCQKLNPNGSDTVINDLYDLLHQLLTLNGKISKAFFEYSPSGNHRATYPAIFNSYTNFIWNEFDVNVLLELGCFLLKYRLHDVFGTHRSSNHSGRQKIAGYFIEILAIYYLSAFHRDYFENSRSVDMILPSPVLYPSFQLSQMCKNDDTQLFLKFLKALDDNGEVSFDIRQIKLLLQNDNFQFINQKLENKKFDFVTFLENSILQRQQNSCRSLKSLCRLSIKKNIKQYPADIQYLSSLPRINDHLQKYLIYDNKFATGSYL